MRLGNFISMILGAGGMVFFSLFGLYPGAVGCFFLMFFAGMIWCLEL